MELPIKFTERMKESLGREYSDYEASLSRSTFHGLRFNDKKVDRETFLRMMPFSLEPVLWAQNGFYYDEDLQPAKHPYYHGGLFYIQEPSAMAPVSLLDVQKDDNVLDLCGAPGGKSTQIGALLGPKGLLVSNDISPSRAKAIVKNIELFGIENSLILSEEPKKLENRFAGFFDKILVDAPCSGEGMFRKDPSMIKNWEKKGIDHYRQIQMEILPCAARMLAPGGKLMYSTCTFSIEENEAIIKWFLRLNPEFKIMELRTYDGFEDGMEGLREAKRLWPHRLKGEGHFVALLYKKDGEAVMPQEFTFPSLSERQLKPYLDFEKELLNIELDRNRMFFSGDRLYLLPYKVPDLKSLRALRTGWYLGEIKRDRFEPSQAFASGLKKNEVRNWIDFSVEDQNVIRYLKGESLNVEAKEGYQLVCVDGFPLGWAKKSGNILKNKYSPGWRLQ